MDWLTAFDTLLSQSDIEADMRPPASLENIQAFEAALAEQERVKGFALPPSYRAFLLRYDGGSVDDSKSGSYPRFLSIGEYQKPWHSLLEYNAADSVLMDHEIETYYTFEPLVIIGTDEGSNFWALDPTQRRVDGEMPVRFCDHESGDIYAQSADFASFVLLIANRQLKYRGLENPVVEGPSW